MAFTIVGLILGVAFCLFSRSQRNSFMDTIGIMGGSILAISVYAGVRCVGDMIDGVNGWMFFAASGSAIATFFLAFRFARVGYCKVQNGKEKSD